MTIIACKNPKMVPTEPSEIQTICRQLYIRVECSLATCKKIDLLKRLPFILLSFFLAQWVPAPLGACLTPWKNYDSKIGGCTSHTSTTSAGKLKQQHSLHLGHVLLMLWPLWVSPIRVKSIRGCGQDGGTVAETSVSLPADVVDLCGGHPLFLLSWWMNVYA